MSIQVRVAPDGSLPLHGDIVRAIGIGPGDRVTVDTRDGAIVVTPDPSTTDAAGRLRAAMRGYSVEQFLRERNADWGE
jgi:hypothetical protein